MLDQPVRGCGLPLHCRAAVLAWVRQQPGRSGDLWTDGHTLAWRGRVLARHRPGETPELWPHVPAYPSAVRAAVRVLARCFPGALWWTGAGPPVVRPAEEVSASPPPFCRPLGVEECEP